MAWLYLQKRKEPIHLEESKVELVESAMRSWKEQKQDVLLKLRGHIMSASEIVRIAPQNEDYAKVVKPYVEGGYEGFLREIEPYMRNAYIYPEDRLIFLESKGYIKRRGNTFSIIEGHEQFYQMYDDYFETWDRNHARVERSQKRELERLKEAKGVVTEAMTHEILPDK